MDDHALNFCFLICWGTVFSPVSSSPHCDSCFDSPSPSSCCHSCSCFACSAAAGSLPSPGSAILNARPNACDCCFSLGGSLTWIWRHCASEYCCYCRSRSCQSCSCYSHPRNCCCCFGSYCYHRSCHHSRHYCCIHHHRDGHFCCCYCSHPGWGIHEQSVLPGCI